MSETQGRPEAEVTISNSVKALSKLVTQWIVVIANMTATTQSSMVAGNFRDPFRLEYGTIPLSADEQGRRCRSYMNHEPQDYYREEDAGEEYACQNM